MSMAVPTVCGSEGCITCRPAFNELLLGLRTVAKPPRRHALHCIAVCGNEGWITCRPAFNELLQGLGTGAKPHRHALQLHCAADDTRALGSAKNT